MFKVYRKIFEITDYIRSKFRILHLRLKYQNIVIDNKTRIEKNCKIVCVDTGSLILKGCHISEGSFIIVAKNAELSIHDTFLGRNCLISSNKSIIIKNDCLIAEMVVIRDHNHKYNLNDDTIASLGNDKGAISIENNVWIGTKATILKGVFIGKNSVIGAHSLVNTKVEANSVFAGIPAKKITRKY
mgnify:FL=1